MREFKFRTFMKGEFIYSGSNKEEDNQLDMFFCLALPGVEIEQFTGLQDKTGKEIYEGDMVRLKNWAPCDMQICFIEGAFCLADIKTGEYVGDIHYVQHAGVQQSEVIGNIHENPELMK